jgi:hypothetical protein
VKDFLPITVHMHLKDYKGWEHFAGYCPLGEGKVDLKAILDMVEGSNPNANIMHELDGSANAPYTPSRPRRSAKRTCRSSATHFERVNRADDATSSPLVERWIIIRGVGADRGHAWRADR